MPLQGLIPPQNFEQIRDIIVRILTIEFASQYAMNNSYPKIDKIWSERYIPFNSETELPTINVNISKGGTDNQSNKKLDGEYTYNIDCYTNASTTTENGPGDQYAMILMSKVAGMVCAILRNPLYNNLTLEPGIVIRTRVKGFFIGDKSTVEDALHSVVGRVQFVVEAIETNKLLSGSTELQLSTTQVKL